MDEDTLAGDSDLKVYEVSLDPGPSEADTTELLDISEFRAGHIAASNDGGTLYVVDEFNSRLAVVDVSGPSYSLNPIDDPNGVGPLGDVVQAATDTDGTLYLGSKSEDALFEVSDPGGAAQVERRIDPGVDIAGADNVFASNGQFYFFTNAGRELYTVDLLSGATSQVNAPGVPDTDLTGLAISDAGSGDFIGSESESTEIIEFDLGGGSNAYELTGDLIDDRDQHTFGDLTTGELCERTIDGLQNGTLREVVGPGGALRDGGIQLSTRTSDCFQPGFTRYIGVAWWVPEEVGNEIQGDSVSFDLGFYTEQCRNNDGSGPS
jgi:hypothetical protein